MLNKIDGRTTDTKQRILKEAKQMYLKGGYAGISLQELADRLEISKPALFHHFKSKQELFYGVLLDISEANMQTVKQAVEDGQDNRSRLRNVLLAMRRLPFFDPMKFLSEEMSELTEIQQREIYNYFQSGMQKPVIDILEQGVHSGEFRPHNSRIGALAFTNLMMLLPSPGSPIAKNMPQEGEEDYIDELLGLFLDGLRARSEF